jgi:hypothetical protein
MFRFFFVHLFAHGAMSPSVSVKNFQDADAIYAHILAHINKSEMTDLFSVSESDIQPGIVFLTKNRLVDGINWGMAPTMLVGQNSI